MIRDDDILQSFVEEARIHVETVEAELLKLDTGRVDEESIHNIFRAVHSIKGTSGFLDLKKIVELSHAMENIFGEIRSGKKKITEGMIDILLCANDCMRIMVDDVKNSEIIDTSEAMEGLSRIIAGMLNPSTAKKDASSSSVYPASLKMFDHVDRCIKAIHDNAERGHKVYRIKKMLGRDITQNNTSLPQFIELVNTLGMVIDCSADIEGIQNGQEPEDIGINLLFSSVLEKDMLAPVLELTEEEITEFQVSVDEDCSEGQEEQQEDRVSMHKAAEDGDQCDIGDHPVKGQSSAAEDSIRVNVALLNSLLNLASEMVLARNQLLRIMEGHRKNIPGIDPIFQNVDHITTNLQEKIMQTRMQPVSNIFNKFPRIIRELSKKLGKNIRLHMEGSDVELDKSIIEALGDPLTHLIRNAADHGLEMPEEREKEGKSRDGMISLKAYHEGGYVNIDVVDDGRGIDIESVKKKAVEKNFVSRQDLAVMGELDILKLLFRPGFSTSDKVSDISGRGVGMDVVKTNIEKLGGNIEIFTTPGTGTTFRLLLPLTLAIISSLIVETEGQKFALPQVNLQEIVRIKSDDASRKIEYINNAEVLRLRGRLLPVIHLADVLGIRRTYIDRRTGKRYYDKRKTLFSHKPTAAKSNGVHEERRKSDSSDIVKILVIKMGSRRLGLAVDSIHESEEILVKTLPSYFKECKCYSGVTILGDGKAAMILDPGGIIEKSNLHYLDGVDERAGDKEEDQESIREDQNLLLFQCSGPETLALDMSMVSRVEEVMSADIERIGDREFIKFRGASLRVIRPEEYLPISNERVQKEKYYVIIPKLVSRPLGILIERILDTVRAEIDIRQDDSIKVKGLIGSSILNNTIVLLVNVYELFETADPEHYKAVPKHNNGDMTNILLAEDTPFFQTLEKTYLEEAGYTVHLAKNGKEALDLLLTRKIDAVASDINMPVMDGLELVRRIRADPELAHLPVIAITSLIGEAQVKEGLEAGFDAYEFKLDRQRLLQILDSAIKKRRRMM